MIHAIFILLVFPISLTSLTSLTWELVLLAQNNCNGKLPDYQVVRLFLWWWFTSLIQSRCN